MKVLQVNKLYAPAIGGVETVVKDIAEGLQVDMEVLVCQRKGKSIKEEVNGVKVVRAGSFGTVLSMPLSLSFFNLFRKMAKKADIIFLHSPFPLADLAVLLFGRKKKLVVWWHSDIVRQKFILKLLSPIVHHTLKKATIIIAAAQANIESSLFLTQYKDKCVVIPYGIDIESYPKFKNNCFLTNKLRNRANKKLLFVGRLVYYKGLHILIEAMRDVSDAELFIVGRGPLDEPLKQEINKHSLEKKVHMLGTLQKNDLLQTFADCDIFVFPSCANSEAFGLTQLDAMYYGKPVINTNLPTAVPWVSVHNRTGITIPVGSVSALAEAINLLVQDDCLQETYGTNANARVLELFDQKKMLKDLHALLKEC